MHRHRGSVDLGQKRWSHIWPWELRITFFNKNLSKSLKITKNKQQNSRQKWIGTGSRHASENKVKFSAREARPLPGIWVKKKWFFIIGSKPQNIDSSSRRVQISHSQPPKQSKTIQKLSEQKSEFFRARSAPLTRNLSENKVIFSAVIPRRGPIRKLYKRTPDQPQSGQYVI